ncbi:IQ motif, EF-hand binding site [Trema orientale]|uniref:IQ motif, EF-hand binding site n=1 Tax=Trema orientale TaxID=63057 RepID=A0A2P5ANU6_TREOI|nr:IQ motif, EF-hand binding site [Trema orientale]
MAKKSGTSSWLTVVKRVFRSPTKDDNNGKKSCRRRDENHENEDEEKKREKRRWLFRKPALHVSQHCGPKSNTNDSMETSAINPVLAAAEQRHAMVVAAGTAAAAATAQAAVEIVRLTRPSSFVREQFYAAIVIQTAFRGYLARRALRALKGLVKLQALVRGQNVRKQAKLTLKCMQALVRVQDQVRHQRARLSLEGSSRKSMLDELNYSLWDSTYLQDIRNRVSISRETSRGAEHDWDDCPQTSAEIEAKLQSRKEACLKREKALAYAFSHQIWRTRRNPSAGNEEELEERTKWLDRWMATKQWENTSDYQRRDSNIRTVEVDTTSGPLSSYSAPNIRRQQQQHQPHKAHQTGPQVGPNISSSPLHRAQYTVPFSSQYYYNSSPVTPSPSKTRPLKLKVRSASPRCSKEERCYSAVHTPSLGSGATCRFGIVPNYMAATESAKARARPLSAPRQRPSTPERDQRGSSGGGSGLSGCGSAKKRLNYPVLEPQNDVVGNGCGGSLSASSSQQLRSPSFKSLQNGFYGMENLSSCYTESLIGRDVSPCSTTDLRWLK